MCWLFKKRTGQAGSVAQWIAHWTSTKRTRHITKSFIVAKEIIN